MDWKKEDSRYLAATVAAVVLVGFLVAGNFGLLPSPLAGAAPDSVTDVVVPAFATGPDAVAAPGSPPVVAQVLGDLLVPVPPDPQPPAVPQPPVDTVPPVSSFSTPDGAVLTGVEVPVTGTTTDDRSGVDRVQVTFRVLGSDEAAGSRTADLDCADASRRFCTWTVNAPLPVGQYTVTAQATDRAGNTESPGPSITVVVITATPDGSGGPLGSLVDTVGSVTKPLTDLITSLF